MPFLPTISSADAIGALKREYDAAMARAGRIWNWVLEFEKELNT